MPTSFKLEKLTISRKNKTFKKPLIQPIEQERVIGRPETSQQTQPTSPRQMRPRSISRAGGKIVTGTTSSFEWPDEDEIPTQQKGALITLVPKNVIKKA